MERMRITVERIEGETDDCCIAAVSAVSRRRIGQLPAARITLTVAIAPPRRGERADELRQRARDEALKFLDVE